MIRAVSVICALTVVIGVAASFAVATIAAGLFEGKANQQKTRIDDLEQEIAVLCGRKYIVDLRFRANTLAPIVKTERGC